VDVLELPEPLSPKFQDHELMVDGGATEDRSVNETETGEQSDAVTGEKLTTGSWLTLTVTCAVDVHPFKFPVTIYVVVETGFAVTLVPVVELNAVDGVHT